MRQFAKISRGMASHDKLIRDRGQMALERSWTPSRSKSMSRPRHYRQCLLRDVKQKAAWPIANLEFLSIR
jgi:hypothetical protein